MSLDEFRNKEYKVKMRQTFFELLRYRPDILENMGAFDVQGFVEECAVQKVAELWKFLPNPIVVYIQRQGDEAVQSLHRSTSGGGGT